MLLALASLALAGCLHAAPTLTGNERALPDDAMEARVIAQLRETLTVFHDYRSNARPGSPLWQVKLATRPHTSYELGSCAMEVVTVDFAPTVAEEAAADTPMRAIAVRTELAFLYREPDIEQREMTPADMQAEQAICARIDPYDPRFVYAPDGNAAFWGYRFYREAITAIAAGNPPFETNCGPDPSACQEMARNDTPERMEISICGQDAEIATCYHIASDLLIDITVRDGRIRRVNLSERVFITSG
jgi:hypothetical protein